MKKNKGFTIAEVVVAVTIATVIVFIISSFARNLILLNSSASSSMTAILETRRVLRVMVSELRSIMPSAQGSYSIESAATSSIVFFADVNSDNLADRINYFFEPSSSSVRRGVVLASGNPPAYNMNTQTFSTLVTGVSNDASIPLFKYYDGNYSGNSSPLSIPVNIQEIRLVEVTIRVQRDPDRFPDQLMTVSSQATLRNLKDNI